VFTTGFWSSSIRMESVCGAGEWANLHRAPGDDRLISARHIKLAGLYWRTIRHLRLRQIAGRLANRIPKPDPARLPAPPLRTPEGKWAAPIARHASVLGQDRFLFLNREIALEFPTGWNDARLPKLWLYNLHYFDHLGGEPDPVRAEISLALALRWIAENPPAAGNGWEPYPLSLRIVNWLKFSMTRGGLPPVMCESLAIQIRALEQRIEWHILANHLFANAKALTVAGLCHDGPEADRWLTKGLHILDREMPEQILRDGGHFERSPMYHAIILEDLLDLLNADGAHPGLLGARTSSWRDIAAKMLAWLSAMTHPDGDISFFNDSTLGVCPTLLDLRGYADRLGVTTSALEDARLNDLKASGYVRANVEPFALIFDAAPIGPDYQPGHAHADTLSIELSVGAQRVFVNSGVSTYEANDTRALERSTAAHNAVEIAGASSSEVWAAFRVARRARIVKRDTREIDGAILLEASHDGYRFRGKHTIVSRSLSLTHERLVIKDWITGNWRDAVSRLRLQPGLAAVLNPDRLGGWIEKEGRRFLIWSSSAPAHLAPIHHASGFNRRDLTQEIQFPFQTNELLIDIRAVP